MGGIAGPVVGRRLRSWPSSTAASTTSSAAARSSPPQWILTAAHCAIAYRTQPATIEVVGGRADLRTQTGTVSSVLEIVIHPAFDRPARRNDLALLRLNGPIPQPAAPLMTADVEPAYNGTTTGVVAGWGADTPNGSAGVVGPSRRPGPAARRQRVRGDPRLVLERQPHLRGQQHRRALSRGQRWSVRSSPTPRGHDAHRGRRELRQRPVQRRRRRGSRRCPRTSAWIQSLIGAPPQQAPPPPPGAPRRHRLPPARGTGCSVPTARCTRFGAAAVARRPDGAGRGLGGGAGHDARPTRVTGS